MTLSAAGSAGSDLNGFAVLCAYLFPSNQSRPDNERMPISNACVELKKRLEPYRAKLGPEATFQSIVSAAWGDRVSLQAVGHHATPDLGYEWNNQKPTGEPPSKFCESEVGLIVGTMDRKPLPLLHAGRLCDRGRGGRPHGRPHGFEDGYQG